MIARLPTARVPLVIFVALNAAVSSTVGQTYRHICLGMGPVAYWTLDGVNEYSLTNGFSSSYQGDATNTLPSDAVRLPGLATNASVFLDGADDYVQTGLDDEEGFPDAATIIAWVRFSRLPSEAGRIFTIVAKSMYDNDLDLQVHPDNRLYFYVARSYAVACEFPGGLMTNVWYHVAASFDDVADRQVLYVDGNEVVSQLYTAERYSSSTPLSIGESLVFRGRYFQGSIDEVAVFSRALSPHEIRALYEAAIPSIHIQFEGPDIVVDWPAVDVLILQACGSLMAPTEWIPVGLPPLLTNGRYRATVDTGAAPQQFFRVWTDQ